MRCWGMSNRHGNPVPGQFSSWEEEEGGDHCGNQGLISAQWHQWEGGGLQHHLKWYVSPGSVHTLVNVGPSVSSPNNLNKKPPQFFLFLQNYANESHSSSLTLLKSPRLYVWKRSSCLWGGGLAPRRNPPSLNMFEHCGHRPTGDRGMLFFFFSLP